MTFEPVRTAIDLAHLNQAEVIDGYVSASRGDPEPGQNRGRAFWHGWRTRMIDMGEIPPDEASRQLVHEYVTMSKDTSTMSERDWADELARDLMDDACLPVPLTSIDAALRANIAAALRAAYNRGVEESAKAVDEDAADYIRALLIPETK